jgi:hypothetical protein
LAARAAVRVGRDIVLVREPGNASRRRGAVLSAFSFQQRVCVARGDVLKAYYGDCVAQKCPFELLEALISPVLNVEGELDP